MTRPGPCCECEHTDWPDPTCRCQVRGCWCPVSGMDPLDLPIPQHVLRGQTELAVDLDALAAGERQ